MSSSFPAVTVRQIGAAAAQAVNARDLHAFLGIGRDFSSWIKDRIEGFAFDVGSDFATYDAGPQNGGAGNRGARIEYALSIDMAKELAMVERSAKGKQVRLYFIECERRAKAAVPVLPDFSNPATLKSLLLQSLDAQIELQGQVAVLAPKAAIVDRLECATGDLVPTDAAKLLKVEPYKLLELIDDLGWAYRPRRRRVGAAKAIAAGYVSHRPDTVPTRHGEITTMQLMITPKGRNRLAQILNERAAAIAVTPAGDLFVGGPQ